MIPPTGVRSGYFFPPGRSGRGALPFQSRLAQAGQVVGGVDASQLWPQTSQRQSHAEMEITAMTMRD